MEELELETYAMNLRQKVRDWIVFRETVDRLNRCSDRSLDDLGIARHEIRTVARRHALRG